MPVPDVHSSFIANPDLPDVELYVPSGEVWEGLLKYHCGRGSSAEESYHGHMNKLFSGGNTGKELAQVSYKGSRMAVQASAAALAWLWLLLW